MRYWINDRIHNFPKFYQQRSSKREHVVLQAASDIFFCEILIYINAEEYYAIRPRQQANLIIKDCGRVLKMWWSIDSKYGVLLNDEPPLMRCPFANKKEIPVISDGPERYREQESQLNDI